MRHFILEQGLLYLNLFDKAKRRVNNGTMAEGGEAHVPFFKRVISRRGFLGKSAAVGGAAVAGAIVGRETAPGFSVPRSETPSTRTINLTEFPKLTEFTEVVMGGKPVEGSLEQGPKGYYVEVRNGQRVNIHTQELDKPSYVRTQLFDPDGQSLIENGQTNIDTEVFKDGPHFLVVDKYDQKTGNKFQLEVKDGYKISMDSSFILRPNKENHRQVRFDPDSLQVIDGTDFGILLNTNDPSSFDASASQPTYRGKIEVYAVPGTVNDLKKQHADFPEDKPSNRLGAELEYKGENSVMVKPVTVDNTVNEPRWPNGSHIAIVVKRPGGGTWVTRFFTL